MMGRGMCLYALLSIFAFSLAHFFSFENITLASFKAINFTFYGKKNLCVENDKKNSMWHHEELRDDTELCKKKKSCWLKGKWKLGTHRERVENLLRNHFRIESI